MTTWLGWTDEAISKLHTLWDAGLTTREIGLRMGISKSAVAGAARRYDCAVRGNPGGWNNPAKVTDEAILEALRAGKGNVFIAESLRVRIGRVAMLRKADPTLPQIVQRRAGVAKAKKPTDPHKVEANRIAASKRSVALKQGPKFAAPRVQPHGRCLYLIGDSKPWLQCDQPIAQGSFCRAHALICYVPFSRGEAA